MRFPFAVAFSTPKLVAFFTLVFVTVSYARERECPKDCYSHVYSLSSDNNGDCTHREHCLLRARITVVQQGSFDEMLNITLMGYGMRNFEERNLAIRFEQDKSEGGRYEPGRFDSDLNRIEYACNAPRYGRPKATITQADLYPYHVGNIYNTTGKLLCNWVFSKDTVFWPRRANGSIVDLINERNWRISLVSNNVSKIVAWDLSKFPLYKMNYLRCCYAHHGGSNYLLVTNQTTTTTNFYVQAFRPIPRSLSLVFTNQKGHSFTIVCGRSSFNATMRVGSRYSPVRDILYAEPFRVDEPIPDFRCAWSQPVVLNERAGTMDTRDGQFSLDISSDIKPPYREPVINLRGAGKTIIASLLLVALPLVLSFIL